MSVAGKLIGPVRARRDRRRAPAPFVVGVSRSGTTLLRFMLDAHPDLAIPPETHFLTDLIDECRRDGASPESAAELVISHRRFGDFGLEPDEVRERFRRAGLRPPAKPIRAFYELYAERQDKPRWGDKTPNYIKSMPRLGRVLPEARFIHLVRDGRDAALSRASRAVGEPAPLRFLARRWRRRIVRARREGQRVGHYLEARYEDLVTDPEPTLRRICEFLALDFHPAMLDYHEGASERLAEMDRDLPAKGGKPVRSAEHRIEGHSLVTEPPQLDRIGRWRREMSDPDRETFERIAGDMLVEFGYEVGPAGEHRAEKARLRKARKAGAAEDGSRSRSEVAS